MKAVVAKVQLGEADAGLVYRSDVTPSVSRYVRVFEIDDAYNVIASYPIAVLKGAKNTEAAQWFVELVSSAARAAHPRAARPAARRRRGAGRYTALTGFPASRRAAHRSRRGTPRAVAVVLGALLVLLLGLPLREPRAPHSTGRPRRPAAGPAHPAGAPAEPRDQPRRDGDRRRARAARRLPARHRASSAASACWRRSSTCRWCCRRPWPGSPCSRRSAGRAWPARRLSALGITLPFTTLGVVVAQAFVAAPFFVGAARAGFAEVDRKYLDAAATLRAAPGYAFSGCSSRWRRPRCSPARR